jgi:hypothetical protein
MHFNPVSDVARRLIFPNGLKGPQTSARIGALPQSVMVSPGRSQVERALDRYNPVTPLLQRVLSSHVEMELPVPPSHRGWLSRIFRPERGGGTAARPAVQQAVEKLAEKSQPSAFKVSRTRHVDGGFEVIGYPRWKGITLPLRTSVQMGLGSASDGSWALAPNSVSVWGVPSAKLRDKVKLALRSVSTLQHDAKTDNFRIVIS